MKGKILVLSLAILALSIAGSATTLSYFTDADSSTANFTVGKVKIRTIATSIGRWENETQMSDADLITNSSGYSTYLQEKCSNMLGEVDKPAVCNRYIFVQNTGTVAAYVRVKVQIPINDYYNKIRIQYGGSKEYDVTEPNFGDPVNCASGGGLCFEYVFTRFQPLQPGTMTANPSLTAMTYSGVAQTNTTDDGEEGSSGGADLSTNGIRVYTQAIQAQCFSSATEAFSQYK